MIHGGARPLTSHRAPLLFVHIPNPLIPMKLLLTSLLIAGSACALSATPSPVRFDWFEYTGRDDLFAAPLAKGQFRNPILAGFYPDPAICRVGEDY